ncbi:hypothetical protein AVEN_185112-1 [Araneus ventricosus]|uniref:Uncharacterized protein n=1 Tax=Araneus ventricosus TaxID=182803 RepID=A0A4Y2MN39_ARAVE|nr:hypothetical protein AVEN_185112-1 [Araneus ventricosus]
MALNSTISEMLADKVLNRICNVWRSAVLYDNCATHTCTLLKCWNGMVAQKRFIAYTTDSTVNRTHRTYVFEKEWPYDKHYRKPAPYSYSVKMKNYWLISESISFCPYSAILSFDISVDMKMSFICPKDVSSFIILLILNV